MAKSPELVIYDLDGVITDTAEFHYLAWKNLAEQLGILIDRNFNEQLKGISRMDSLDRILELGSSAKPFSYEEKVELATRKNSYYLELIEEITPDHILPGIKNFLQENKEANIKIALGSASKNAPLILEKLGLSHYFDYVVDAGKVKKGKPDPETFTAAADALGVSYSNCIGIEDAAAGVEAVNRANMFSVGVGDRTHLAHAHYLVNETSELDFQKIIQQFQKWRQAY
ncbi:beta-phosphoglucomutase [Planococcus sp. CP5-4]|uniref:beta-phosphoglucomutase n=1 Tax=unclassified Planococcus (in: firmicutes) TaxID=2662419 RepID=UPI001C232E48|nr:MULTISPECIES: beta-phosphoglucomutase [unclassified Planococcus (in: firmicutes)]MBU9674065.1 beta-phosphoglucomutase [Planococcus sp. CP5-4_YE]MBV0909936.1 beta-phosphoglucomutase [Planococcus sp. CP5-4_UN]MBW6064816.1 beta-phosphoglucomutase [Planococcus sp. CP5-4]